MQTSPWFAVPPLLRVEAIAFERGGATVLTSPDIPAPMCPDCGRPSRRVHGHYTRSVADLPWGGVPVRFRIRARKLRCTNPSCPRKVFAERLEGVARRYARRTERQREALEGIGFALGGV